MDASPYAYLWPTGLGAAPPMPRVTAPAPRQDAVPVGLLVGSAALVGLFVWSWKEAGPTGVVLAALFGLPIPILVGVGTAILVNHAEGNGADLSFLPAP